MSWNSESPQDTIKKKKKKISYSQEKSAPSIQKTERKKLFDDILFTLLCPLAPQKRQLWAESLSLLVV